MCTEYTTVMYTKFYLPGTLNVSVGITVLQRTRLFKRSLALIENDSVSRTNILNIYLLPWTAHTLKQPLSLTFFFFGTAT